MSLLNRQLGKTLKYHLNFQSRLQQTQAKPNVTTAILSSGPVFKNVPNFADKIALRDTIASYTYANLFLSANELSQRITKLLDGKTNERVLFLCPNDANYIITMWAIWMSGQIAVPLSPLHPKNILLYYANDTSSKLLITTPQFSDLMHRISSNTGSRLHVLDDKMRLSATLKCTDNPADLEGGQSNGFYDKNSAMILYTSGTTGNPKGVVLTHKNLNAQITTLIDAWRWTSNDVILHTLPLHHVHGTVNALLCPLYIGAKTIMLPKFNAQDVWARLLGVNAPSDERKVSVFMAVPTIYSKLIDEYNRVFKKDEKMVEYIHKTLKNRVRLMVSGSAPLPVPIYEKWLEISGHRLLERYGMTEIGMCLSNEYDSDREPGYIGVPLPGVSVRLAQKEDEESVEYQTLLECTNKDGKVTVIPKVTNNVTGELLVKGDNVFKEYYKRSEATRKEFTPDGWFKTGDMSEFCADKKKFRMLGRKSVDIIKSGGYKISALEIETHLLAHSDVADCAVVGLDDDQWGQKVAAIVLPVNGKEVTLESVTEFLASKLPKYALPKIVKVVDSVPKNAMGKVNKKELVNSVFNDDSN